MHGSAQLLWLDESKTEGAGDDRAMQIEVGLKAVEKKLSKAHARIDRHHTRYTNLFFAYFDLKDKSGKSAE